MTIPTHTLVGLIIGKLSGDYATALAGSLLIDVDHLVSYFRHGILFHPRKLFAALSTQEDPWGDQRNFLHSVFSWVTVSLIFLIIDFRLGVIFSIAYFFHLVLDALDNGVFYPFFPLKKFPIRGFIAYYSRQEAVFNLCLVAVFFLVG